MSQRVRSQRGHKPSASAGEAASRSPERSAAAQAAEAFRVPSLERARRLGHRIDRVLAPLLQRAYRQDPTDPAQQAAAIEVRFNDGAPHERFNVSTVAIRSAAGVAQATNTRKSLGGGVDFHAERRALSADMDEAGIAGYQAGNHAATGNALAAGGIASIRLYTEFPPCPGACEPYLRGIEERLEGDVDVTFSDELEDWTDLTVGQKAQAWARHYGAVAPEAEEEEAPAAAEAPQEVQAPAAAVAPPEAAAVVQAPGGLEAMDEAHDHDEDQAMAAAAPAGAVQTVTFGAVPNQVQLAGLEEALGEVGINAYQLVEAPLPWDPPSVSWEGPPGPEAVRAMLQARGLPIL